MKKILLGLSTLCLLNLSPSFAQMGDRHGGGNGGDDFEMTIKKRSLQISYFVKSTIGSQVFSMLNGQAVIDTVNKMDIDVIEGDVTDKYGSLRTCVNFPERYLITCNLERISQIMRNQDDVFTALLFHEILGLMGLELGYQDNVSMYPISSKILAYNDVVIKTPISEAQIRPEFYGLDSRSYGITLKNRRTGETLRMICLNDNVQVNQCRNYSVVRKANGLQSPLLPEMVSLSPERLKLINPAIYNNIGFRTSKLTKDLINTQGSLSLVNKEIKVSNRVFEKVVYGVSIAIKSILVIEANIAQQQTQELARRQREERIQKERAVQAEKNKELLKKLEDSMKTQKSDWLLTYFVGQNFMNCVASSGSYWEVFVDGERTISKVSSTVALTEINPYLLNLVRNGICVPK